MAYIVAADLRPTSSKWFAARSKITVAQVTSDATITDAIAAVSAEIDEYTRDHFEPLTPTTLTVGGSDDLVAYLPARIRTLSQVEVRDSSGVFTVLPATSYRLSSSVAGSVVHVAGYDFLSFIQWYGDWTTWPSSSQSIRLTGTFGWPATPEGIKLATALIVADRLLPAGDLMRRANAFQTADASYQMASTSPSGIPDADRELARYRRPIPPVFSVRLTTDRGLRVPE